MSSREERVGILRQRAGLRMTRGRGCRALFHSGIPSISPAKEMVRFCIFSASLELSCLEKGPRLADLLPGPVDDIQH